MLTAGHCDNETWRHNGVTIGVTNLNNLTTSGSVLGDFQRVPMSTASTPLNRIFLTSSLTSREIVAFRSYANQHQGDTACASGRTSGNRCGTIIDDDRYYGIVFRGQTKYMWGKVASLSSGSGDSGGPAYVGNTALGIVSAVDGSNTAYGVSDLAMQALSIRFCLDSSCS
jgi:hypothetical protein